MLDALPLDTPSARQFHHECETKTLSQLRGAPESSFLQRLDNRLYTAITVAVRTSKQQKYLDRIETVCGFGAGRQALKALDEKHHCVASKLAEACSEFLTKHVVDKMEGLEEYCSKVRMALMKMSGLPGVESPEVRLKRFVRRALEPLFDKDRQLNAAIAAYDAEPASERTFVELLETLETVALL